MRYNHLHETAKAVGQLGEPVCSDFHSNDSTIFHATFLTENTNCYCTTSDLRLHKNMVSISLTGVPITGNHINSNSTTILI